MRDIGIAVSSFKPSSCHGFLDTRIQRYQSVSSGPRWWCSLCHSTSDLERALVHKTLCRVAQADLFLGRYVVFVDIR
jgi:hypothetical protein